jgi:outer membrane lipoprotein SlyB
MRTSALIVASLALLGANPSWAERAGQSVTIQYGQVTSVRDVDLQSNAVPAGALIGGGLGIVSGIGRSSSTKARNGIIGAIAGGALASGLQGHPKGVLYQVDAGSGGVVQVVSDQREIRTGDCVAVEKTGDTANIRRVSSAYCTASNKVAVSAVASEAHQDAEACTTAKQQLVDAKTTQDADLAARKMTLLCNS